MPGVLLRTKETVAWEHPAVLAISVMVTRRLALLPERLRRDLALLPERLRRDRVCRASDCGRSFMPSFLPLPAFFQLIE
jgi:hypothetical protein